MNNPILPCILTIAGTDPSGGAGIQADIKSISATGGYAASVITALVAQNTMGVDAIIEVDPQFIKRQLESVFNDLTISAVKIGMLHNREVIDIVADTLKYFSPPFIVLDPVMVAKDGSFLLKSGVLSFLKEKLIPIVNLITPNLFEAECLLDQKIATTHDMAIAAKKLAEIYKTQILLKGGHLEGLQAADVLVSYHTVRWFQNERINTRHTHGTGCTLSAAIASYLAQDYSLEQAVEKAKNYLTQAIQAGSQLNIGRGSGPVDHFYFLRRSKHVC